MSEVRNGQLWADRDSREVKAGARQRLRVVGIHNETHQVHLNNEETGRDSWVRRYRFERRFRLVEEPT